jgi:CRP-like cAMP-binding protein
MQDDLEIVFRMMDIQGQRLVEADRRLERLARSLVRVRVVAHCLARVLSAEGRLPLGLEARSIAAELGLTAAAVNETITSVAESGVGTMRNGYWHFDDPAHIGKLTALLCRYASER